MSIASRDQYISKDDGVQCILGGAWDHMKTSKCHITDMCDNIFI